MSRKPKLAAKPDTNPEVPQAQDAQPVVVAPGLFVLKKNHGLTFHGRTHKFYAAGTTFDPAKDGELISSLVRSGAHIEEVPVEVESVEEVESTGGDASQGEDTPEGNDKPDGDQSSNKE